MAIMKNMKPDCGNMKWVKARRGANPIPIRYDFISQILIIKWWDSVSTLPPGAFELSR